MPKDLINLFVFCVLLLKINIELDDGSLKEVKSMAFVTRKMKEVKNEEIDLIITSPPYWHIKDYRIPGQIGYGQTLHEYLKGVCIATYTLF